MTAENTLTGASSHIEIDWHSIDWKQVHRNVRRLQTRMVKAIQEGRWGKVKALQHLLTHSFSAKALAVKRMTENPGKRTAGVDGEIWDTPAKKAQGIQSLRQHGYHVQPLRRVYIPKGNGSGKMRPLGIPTLRDRAFQMLYKLALDPIAETTGDPNSYGFREKRSAADAITRCFQVLSRKCAAPWILEADIQACFDEISHKWLLDNIPINKMMLQQWLKAGIIDRQTFKPTVAGAPQGSPISPVLANLTLDGLEQHLAKHIPKIASKGRYSKVHLIRFADDFIVTADSKALLETQVKPLITQFLADRGLTLSPQKTTITHIEQGFDFLGQNVRKYQGKLLTKPSHKSIKTLKTKLRQIIKANAQSSAGQLIAQLNPLIRGWTNYHRHVVSKRTFKHIDDYLWPALWRWAKRRHLNKPRRWIKRKYFGLPEGRLWDFYGDVTDKHGKTHRLILLRPSDVPIRRHIKVREAANPFDPDWEIYFEQRLTKQMLHRLSGKHKLRSLWRNQVGRCLVCDQMITTETGWHTHHIIYLVNGGDNTLQNQVLLHPNCHRQVHSQGLTVVKPRPLPGVREA